MRNRIPFLTTLLAIAFTASACIVPVTVKPPDQPSDPDGYQYPEFQGEVVESSSGFVAVVTANQDSPDADPAVMLVKVGGETVCEATTYSLVGQCDLGNPGLTTVDIFVTWREGTEHLWGGFIG